MLKSYPYFTKDAVKEAVKIVSVYDSDLHHEWFTGTGGKKFIKKRMLEDPNNWGSKPSIGTILGIPVKESKEYYADELSLVNSEGETIVNIRMRIAV